MASLDLAARGHEVIAAVHGHQVAEMEREAAHGVPSGGECGILFAGVGASLSRRFEFVQEEWVNSGIFIGRDGERDPLCGANEGTGTFTIPQRPVRRRLTGLPSFVTTRGGEYFFTPGLGALRWLAELPG
ncbi:hypothetical protein [Thermoactinospora rubra]|uniref:hypothetical protein n=1 Tax=Thermoactinospora rubra TaxID=1088767 RepID=UPI000A108A46|nr:hypothetical protein [Thermoactinospora rubra]